MHRQIAVVAVATFAAAAEAQLRITEVHPSGSGNAPYQADWIEITNLGPAPVNIAGYRIDDNSNSFGSSRELVGVVTIPAGVSAVFLESASDAVFADFLNAWFGGAGSAPAGYLIGRYTGAGIGLSTGGDAVNLYAPAGTLVTSVTFDASTNNVTFDNSLGLDGAIGSLSVAGQFGAFSSVGSPTEVGSPFSVPTPGAAGVLALAALGAQRRRAR